MTPQGRAIKQAGIDFGNGQTLPFTPCKKGYIPVVGTKRMMACRLHNKAREIRFAKDESKFRKGEVDLNNFWKNYADADDDADDNVEETSENSRFSKKSSGKLKKKAQES
jgi:hypothetical protein